MKAVFVGLLLALATPAVGQVRPVPGSGDPRLQSVEYRPDQVVLLEVAPGYQLSVEFAPDERIESVAVGDSGAWQVIANRRADRLFIKLAQAGVRSNMTVVTDARTYLFDLAPLLSPTLESAYSVRFRYAQTPAPEPEAAVATIEARYALSGTRSLRPQAMSDDGVHTFIEWPETVPLPAVYAIDGQGRETLVNGMIRDGIFVVDGISDRLLFRIDRRTALAVRKLPKKKR